MRKLLLLILIGSHAYGGQLTHTTAEVDEQLDGVYAEIYANSQTNVQTIVGSATVYTLVTNFTANGDSAHCTADYANSKITLTKNGEYSIGLHTSFGASVSGDNWFGVVFAGTNELPDIHFERKIGNANDHGSAGAGGFYNCTNAPIDITYRVRHSEVGVSIDLTKTYMNLNVHRIGL